MFSLKKTTKIAIAVCIVVVILFSIFAVFMTKHDNHKAKEFQKGITQKMEDLGVDGSDCELVIGKIYNSTDIKGSFFLFSGSITSSVELNMKIGFTAKNGESYILLVPVSKVVFIQDENLNPSAKIFMRRLGGSWEPWSKIFQENIDNYLDQIKITLKPEQYVSLLSN